MESKQNKQKPLTILGNEPLHFWLSGYTSPKLYPVIPFLSYINIDLLLNEKITRTREDIKTYISI